MNAPLKKLSDFPDLQKDHCYYSITMGHFKAGLDPNQSIKDKSYVSIADEAFEQDAHLLEELLHRVFTSYRVDDRDELYDFAKNALLSLKGVLAPELMKRIAMNAINHQSGMDLVEAMLDNGLVDINMVYKGYTLLMNTREKIKIAKLVARGCDINARVESETSPWFNKTIYEVALESKKKGWIDYLKPHVPAHVVHNDFQAKRDILRVCPKPSTQLRLYWKSLREGNHLLLEDILNDQTHYHPLITHRDGLGKNLIGYAVNQNCNDVLLELLGLAHYQSHKDELNKKGECYTSNAVGLNKMVSAKILYQAGFRNDAALRDFLESDTCHEQAPEIVNLMIDEGYVPSVGVRLNHSTAYKLSEQAWSPKDIESFFNEHRHYLNFKDFNGKYVAKGTYWVRADKETVAIMCVMLQKLAPINPSEFKKNLVELLGSIGQNEQKVALGLAGVVLKHFPDIQVLDYLGAQGKKPWLIKLNHDKLTQVIKSMETMENEPVVRKVKI